MSLLWNRANFRLGVVLSLVVISLPSDGCAICDFHAGYWCYGRVFDADSGAPVYDARVIVKLYREGELLRHSETAPWASTRTESNGWFDLYYPVAWEGCPSDPTTPLYPPLGLPPDEVHLQIEKADGTAVVTVAVDSTNLFIDYENFGRIELGIIEVFLEE